MSFSTRTPVRPERKTTPPTTSRGGAGPGLSRNRSSNFEVRTSKFGISMTTAITPPPASMIQVPLLDLRAQYGPIRAEILAAMTRGCDSQYFVMGPEVESLERELAAMLEVREAITVSSGTDALLVAMMALGIGPGDEVITPTYSFFATAGCVTRLGATPVFVDVDPVTFNVRADAIAAALTPRTRAIIPVHLYGLVSDMEAIVNLAAGAGVPIIEDAAQAIGAKWHGT